jgi:hypothetical protein
MDRDALETRVRELEDQVARLTAKEDIRRLKSRYFQLMDTKQWEAFRELFTDDFVLYMHDGPFPVPGDPAFPTADALVEYLRSEGPIKRSVHHGHTPDIEFVDDNTATAVWAMFGWNDDPEKSLNTHLYGHYHDQYVRVGDGTWKIASIHLTQLRMDDVK